MKSYLFITGSLNQGGAEFQILLLAKLMQEKGHPVKVLALTDYKFFIPFVDEHNLDYTYFSNGTSKLIRVLKTIRFVNKYKPDNIVSFARKASTVAIVAKVFSFSKSTLLISERTALTLPKLDKYYFNLCRFANIITSNSLSKVQYIKDNFIHLLEKTHFIPNISDKGSNTTHSLDNYTSNYISYIGRISPEKNIDICIKSFATYLKNENIENQYLHIYGEANNIQYLNQIKKLITDLKIEKHVQLKGPTNNVHEIYRSTKAICLFSSYEGFSNVLSEALCAGVPMIVSDIIENKYLVEDQINGFSFSLSDTSNVHVLVKKIFSMNKEEYNIMQRNNLSKAKSIFDQNRIYNYYQSLFNK